MSDLRLALRSLLKNPGFSSVVVVTLALGIGANTAIFSLLDAVMLRPLPVANPDELSIVYDVGPVAPGEIGAAAGRADIYSWPLVQEFMRALPEGAQLAAMTPMTQLSVQAGASVEPAPVTSQLVSGEFFSTFGVTPAAGRLIGPADNRTVGAHPVAVIGYTFWQRQLGGAADVVGKTLTINRVPITIIGVAAERFRGVWAGSTVQIWLPLAMQQAVAYRSNYATLGTDAAGPFSLDPGVYWLNVAVRSTAAQRSAIAEAFAGLYRRSVQALVDAGAEQPRALARHLEVESFARGYSLLRDQYSSALGVLMGLVALLLMAACANVANLMLARWTARRREFAIRLSLGGSRPAVVRQLLGETALLSLAGAALGLAFADWAASLLTLAAVERDVLPASIALDARVLTFCTATTVATATACGVLPALRSTQAVPAAALRDGGERGGRRASTFQPLVAAQVAFSVVLVIAAALLGRSLLELMAFDPGYDRRSLAQIRLNPRAGGASPEELPAMYDRAVARARQVPGVLAADVARTGLASGARNIGEASIPGYEPAPGEVVRFMNNFVGTTYFSTVGIQLLAGRGFDAAVERRGGPIAAIINETAALRYFGGSPAAIGRAFDGGGDRQATIVGVVEDARVLGLREPPAPSVYFSLTQAPPLAQALELRVTGDGLQVGEAVRRIINAEEPRLMATTPTVLVAEQLERGVLRDRLVAGLASAFGVVGLVLACIGLYGVLSYTVARRVPELGVRLALGATPGGVARLVVGDGLRVTLMGIGIGVVVSVLVGRLIRSLLFSVSPLDPVVYLIVPPTLIAAACLAAYLPARRAARVDPMVALRSE